MKYYVVPGYMNKSPQVVNHKGELVATFEELKEAELFVQAVNEKKEAEYV